MERAAYELRGINPNRLLAVQQHAGQEIVDVGCGSGAYVLHFANERRIHGVDHVAYPTWEQRPELFSVSPADNLPFRDASTDTILAFEVLEHLPDPGRALREYYRVARKNVIVTVPNCTITEGLRRSNLLYSHWSDRTHVHFFDLDSVSQLVSSSGFAITEKKLINRISLVPLLAEAFGTKFLLRGRIRRALEMLMSRQYFITCLVIGQKA